MINFFLREDPKATPKIKKIIKQDITWKRKYQPFHIDCPNTHRKICYCINNPVMNVKIDTEKKEQMWHKYQEADKYFKGSRQDDTKTAQESVSLHFIHSLKV
jgi:hypothetical protein